MKLKDIAKIRSGLVISRKKAMFSNENIISYKQLNLKAIDKNGFLDLEELENLDAKERIDNRYITCKGDIVMRLIEPFTSVYIDEDYAGIVVSSNFCIIECKDKYNPMFLAVVLNSDETKKFLVSRTQGMVMCNVNISEISEIEIPNISLEQQNKLAKLFESIHTKQKIRKKQINQENLLQRRIINTIVKGEV